MQRLTFDIPEELHKWLKIHAIEAGKAMAKVITAWIEEKRRDAKAKK